MRRLKRRNKLLLMPKKNGYLPEVELNNYNKWKIEERQATLEERIALRTEERNKEYLRSRAIW